ncbi:hypothetical protein LIER_35472 [Lithospermum erythrorhizon]|uniref:Uncharacterized protein n=1 Tax=Lithospermum erythrorhizon TaxID=34254 RepID=A0AAV3NSU5_LITER
MRNPAFLWQSRGERWWSDLPEAVVTRGKVSVGFVLQSLLKGRANPQRKLSNYWSACTAKVVGADLRVARGNACDEAGNCVGDCGELILLYMPRRERELGLDRRETGCGIAHSPDGEARARPRRGQGEAKAETRDLGFAPCLCLCRCLACVCVSRSGWVGTCSVGTCSSKLGRASKRWPELGQGPTQLIHFHFLSFAAPALAGWAKREGAGLSWGVGPSELIDFSSPCLACAYVRLSACAGVYSRKLGRARRCWAERGRREAHLTQSFLRPIYLVSFPPPPRLACACVCLSVCAGAYSRKLAQVRARWAALG